jgi:hypothetical protein
VEIGFETPPRLGMAVDQGSTANLAPNKRRRVPAVRVEMAKGFTLYMLKAILSGRGDEIVELACTNLRR